MKKLKIILLCSFLIGYTYIYINNFKYIKKDNTTGTIIRVDTKEKYTNYYLNSHVLVRYKGNNKYKVGDVIKVKGESIYPDDNSNFNLFNYKKYLLSKKIYYIIKDSKIKVIKEKKGIYYFKNLFNKRLESINNPYLYTLLMGDNRLDDNIKETYKTNGIMHLFAISGMHINMYVFLIMLILNKINKRIKINYIIVSIILLLYMTLTVMSPSILRSTIGFVIITIFKILEIEIKPITVLSIVLSILIIYNPFYIYDIGFLYSFIITYFLLISSKYLKYKNKISTIILISLISFLAGYPITINNNFEINFLSVLINIVSSIFIIILLPLSIISFIFPSTIGILNTSINYIEKINIILNNYNLMISFRYINIIFVLLFYILLYNYIRKLNIKSIIPILLFIFIHYNINYLDHYSSLTMIDVNQADSFLLKLKHNRGNIVIDAGDIDGLDIGKNSIVPYIKSEGVRVIDFLIITHGDYDHIGSSLELLNNFKVKNIIINSGNDTKDEKKLYGNIIKMSKGKINLNGTTLNFINNINTKDENKDSLIMYTNIDKYSLLFMGDSDSSNENDILNSYNLGKIDILKVGHHGSNTSSSENFINTIKPNIALISVGKNNFYGHPSKRVINLMNKCKVKTYNSSKDGAVKIVFKDKLKVITCY